MKKIFLGAGEIYVDKEPALITTVLGSCVSLVLYDRAKKIGGLIHYLLPQSPENEKHNKYGNCAIINLIQGMKKLGSKREDLRCWILGGSQSIPGALAVGESNIKLAHQMIEEFGIFLQGSSTGGTNGRKIRFNSQKGALLWKTVESNPPPFDLPSIEAINKNIRVLIVDDSKPVRKVIRKMVEADPSFEVIGEAASAMEAETIRQEQRPDVMTLDLNMPEMDGVTYMRKYIQPDPTPTLILSAMSLDSSGPVLEALQLGAFDYLQKPSFADVDKLGLELRVRLKAALRSPTKKRVVAQQKVSIPETHLDKYVIGIGASTGGVEALTFLFQSLPNNIPPIVVVQHMPPVFSKTFSDKLNHSCDCAVKEASNGDKLEIGRILIAPGGKQMRVNKKLSIELTDDPLVNNFRPSVDYLFHSLSNITDKKIIALIMTGMGSDGALALKQLHDLGATTLAQNEASSAVFGMPKAAIELGATDYVESLMDLPHCLAKFLGG